MALMQEMGRDLSNLREQESAACMRRLWGGLQVRSQTDKPALLQGLNPCLEAWLELCL